MLPCCSLLRESSYGSLCSLDVQTMPLHDAASGVRMQVVFCKGAAFCGAATDSARAVPGILEAWLAELQAFQILRAMHSELQAALQQRAIMPQTDMPVWLLQELHQHVLSCTSGSCGSETQPATRLAERRQAWCSCS